MEVGKWGRKTSQISDLFVNFNHICLTDESALGTPREGKIGSEYRWPGRLVRVAECGGEKPKIAVCSVPSRYAQEAYVRFNF
jgi:hypothetical protein